MPILFLLPVDYNISPHAIVTILKFQLSQVEKYRNPLVAEEESIFIYCTWITS
jgi:hypothetical protein